MSVTQVSIANSALVKIGADLISSITQSTRSANLINSLYAYLRDAVLRDHPWHFAKYRTQLSPTGTEPAFGFDYAFDLPITGDYPCLRVLEVEDVNGSTDITWKKEGNQILCNEALINVLYIYQNTDESSWDSMFAEAFAWRIATEVSYALTQSLAMAQNCQQMYQLKLQQARSISGMEGTLDSLVADKWTNARF